MAANLMTRSLVLAMAFFLLGSMTSPAEQPRICNSVAGQADGFSVLTYNVKALPWPLARGREESLAAIQNDLWAQCGSSDRPDIVVLQEAFAPASDDFLRRAGYRFVLRGPAQGEEILSAVASDDARFMEDASITLGENVGRFLDSGLVILSDYPVELIARGAFPQDACAGYDCLAGKGVILARVTLGADLPPIVIGNTHMNSKNSSGAPPERQLAAYRRQVDLASAFVRQHRNGQSPFVFAGDFNMGTVEARREYLFSSPLGVGDGNDGLRSLAAQGQSPRGVDEVIRHGADYQFFFSAPQWRLEATEVEIPFGDANANKQLSDHVGFMVRYRLTPVADERRAEANDAA